MKDVIEKGLTGLSNAGLLNGGNWFVGHFGAEVLSLVFILINQRVDTAAEVLVKRRIEEVFETHSAFFDTPLNKVEDAQHFNLQVLEHAVEESVSNLYVDGHNTIYAALALRALSLYPDLARPEIINGILALLKACEAAGFDRYYGLDHAAFSSEPLRKKFSFTSSLDAAKTALGQHREVITDREVDGEFYFISGSQLHLVTHAQAILELDQLGYKNMVRAGLDTFTKHCICINASAKPDGAEPYKISKAVDPRHEKFWQREKQNPHHAKLAYAVLEIFASVGNINKAHVLDDLTAYWEFYD